MLWAQHENKFRNATNKQNTFQSSALQAVDIHWGDTTTTTTTTIQDIYQ